MREREREREREEKEGSESASEMEEKAVLLAHWCDDDSDTALVMVRMAPRKRKASAILSDMKHFRQAAPMTGLKERRVERERGKRRKKRSRSKRRARRKWT